MTEARTWADQMTSAINTTLQSQLETHLEELELIPAIQLADAANAVAEHRFNEAIAVVETYANSQRDLPRAPDAPTSIAQREDAA
jgi:hypothetical protein